jgi:hypothetical protein
MKMLEIGQVDERKNQLVKKEREIGVVLGDVNVEVERDDELGLIFGTVRDDNAKFHLLPYPTK